MKWLQEQTGSKETVVETPQITVEQPEVAVTTTENKAEGKVISPDEFLKKYMGIPFKLESFPQVESMLSDMSFLAQKQSYSVPTVPNIENNTTNNNNEKKC